MAWLNRCNFSPIGLDLGAHSFKAVQVARKAGGWEMATSVSLARVAAEAPIDKNELLRLSAVLDRRGFTGRDVVISVPAGKLLTAMLELPARAPGVPLDQIAALEFARVHKKEPGQLTMSTWELPAPARASKATYMLGVGAQSQDLEAHTDLIESAGMNIIAMQEPHSAAARGCLHLADSTTGLIGIVDLGWTAVTLTILMHDTIVYTRKLTDFGMGALCQHASESASIELIAAQDEIWRVGFNTAPLDDQDDSDTLDTLGGHFSAVSKEVARAFSYASHRYSDSNISKAILVGGGAAIPGVAQQFETSLSVVSVPGGTRNKENGADAGPALCTALGLALWSGDAR